MHCLPSIGYTSVPCPYPYLRHLFTMRTVMIRVYDKVHRSVQVETKHTHLLLEAESCDVTQCTFVRSHIVPVS